MKTIEVDEELYRYIASHTQHIGESASDILRRMLKFTAGQTAPASPAQPTSKDAAKESQPASVVRARRIVSARCVSCCFPMNMRSRSGR